MMSDLILIAIVWVVGLLVATPGRLRARMRAEVCSGCGLSQEGCKNAIRTEQQAQQLRHPYREFRYHSYKPVARGGLRERSGGDVAMAMAVAAAWPVSLPLWLGVMVFVGFGLSVKKLIFWATPLTEVERQRQARELEESIRDRADAIEKLAKELH